MTDKTRKLSIGRRLVMVISKGVSSFIVYLTAIVYVGHLLKEPIEIVATSTLSAIAVIGGLSGLCFSHAQNETTEEKKKDLMYAGEKFFHSTLLFIQTLFMKYAGDSVLANEFIKNSMFIKSLSDFVITVLLTGVSGYGCFFFFYGFEAINNMYWNRYEKRIQDNIKHS